MRLIILKSVHRLARRSLLTVGVTLVLSCNSGGEAPAPAPFTQNELYLIESYASIRIAQSYYPHQAATAESLLADLGTRIDSLRIAETVQQINRSVDRWVPIFKEIEDRIQRSNDPSSEG